MTLDEIVDGILVADLQGRAGAFDDIIVAMAAAIPDRIPDRRENYAADEWGRIAFESGQASDEEWEWLRGELRRLAKEIRGSAELHL